MFIEIVDDLTMFIGKRGDNDVLQDIFIHDTRTDDRVITMTAEMANSSIGMVCQR